MPAVLGPLQALVGDALVGGVHVDQHQAAGVLRQHVDPVQLGQREAQRRHLPARLLRRHGTVAGGRRGSGRHRGLAVQPRVGGGGVGDREPQATLGRRPLRPPAPAGGHARHRRGSRRRGRQPGVALAAAGAGTGLRQRLVQGAEQEVVDQAPVPEAHLVLGRVHVDVDPPRVDLQEQHEGGMTPVEEHVGIGLAHGVGDDPVAHGTAIDIEVLLAGAAARGGRQTDPAVQPQAGGGMVDGQAVAGEVRAQRLGDAFDAVATVADGTVVAGLPAVVADPQLHLRARQRQRAQPLLDVAQLGALGAQEAPACRGVEEQVAHLDAGARRVRVRRGVADPAAVDLQPPGVLAAGQAGGDGETAHRGDRRQGLAAEAQGADRLEVVEAGDLAGRMPRHRQRQFIRRYTAAVVADADQADAALLQVDVDARGPGVERVLDQLLDHRGRAFDHFAGGDLVDQGVGQRADRHGGTCGGWARDHSSGATGVPVSSGRCARRRYRPPWNHRRAARGW